MPRVTGKQVGALCANGSLRTKAKRSCVISRFLPLCISRAARQTFGEVPNPSQKAGFVTTSDPAIRPTDTEARSLARSLLAGSRHGALATLHPHKSPDQPTPLVTRVAVAPAENGLPMLLISALSLHAKALRANPVLSLLLGDIAAKGDALTHPRLTLIGQARFLDEAQRPLLRQRWLHHHPKALVYVDLPDFAFVAVDPEQAMLNGGFGRAYHLEPFDLT